VVELNEDSPYWHGANHKETDPEEARFEEIVVYTIGIVFLTLVVNATTTSALLKVLDFGKASIAKKINMASALKNIEESVHHKMEVMTGDKFLAGANWHYVQQLTTFDNMYQDDDGEGENDDIFLDRKTTCPDCSTRVVNNPSMSETSDMIEEARHRLLRLEGVSYLTQYEDGRIVQRTTHELHSRTEEMAELDEGYTNVDGVVNEHVVSNNLYAKRGVKIRRRKSKAKQQLGIKGKNVNQEGEEAVEEENTLVTVKSSTPTAEQVEMEVAQPPTCREKVRKMVDALPFEIFFLLLILANMVNIGLEMPKACNSLNLFYVDIAFLVLYIFEFILRLVGHGKDYMPRSIWGWIDFIIIVMAIVSNMGSLLAPNWEGSQECEEYKSGGERRKSGGLQWIKILKVVRVVRIVRVARFFMSEDSKFVQNMINASYNAVMEVNAAMITAEDDIRTNIKQVPISVYKPVSDITSARIQANRFIAKRKFAKLCSERPGVEISLRTRQATAVVVGSALQRVDELFEMGFLEDKDSECLTDILEMKKMNLKRIPNSLDIPEPLLALKIVHWLDGDDDAQNWVNSNAPLQEFSKGQNMNRDSTYRGIYIIVSGTILIKGVRGLARLQALSWDEEGQARRPDMTGRWQETLPRKLLHRLAQPNGVMNGVGHASVGMEDTKDQMLDAKFTFASRGFVLNEINALAPEVDTVIRAICLSDVLAYFLSADKVKQMLAHFSCRFLSLEANMWNSLACRYFQDDKRGPGEWQNLDMAFVIFIDGNHKLKSSTVAEEAGVGGTSNDPKTPTTTPKPKENKVEFYMDYANIQHAILLRGTARSSAIEESVRGPYELHHGEMSLEFTAPKSPEDVVGVVFVVPNSGNDIHEVFSPDLETIREYAAEWIREEGYSGSIDELILRSIQHFDNSPSGPDEDSTLFVAFKNRINQVIKSYSKVHGQTVTAEQVILDEYPMTKKTRSHIEAQSLY